MEEIIQKEEPDREVMKNFYRVKGVKILSEAKKLADRRQYDDAKKPLESFKKELEGKRVYQKLDQRYWQSSGRCESCCMSNTEKTICWKMPELKCIKK